MRSVILTYCVAVLSYFYVGCATSQPVQQSPKVVLRGVLSYEGNPDYLPRTIGTDPTSSVMLRYRYHVEQGREDGTDFFVPLANVVVHGRAGNWVVATGLLEVIENGQTVYSFDALQQRVAGGPYGKTLTDLRREALLAVRSTVETKMEAAQVSGDLKEIMERSQAKSKVSQ